MYHRMVTCWYQKGRVHSNAYIDNRLEVLVFKYYIYYRGLPCEGLQVIKIQRFYCSTTSIHFCTDSLTRSF
jgi:hypothetical protein